MPFSSALTFQYGNGPDAAGSTEVGVLTKTGPNAGTFTKTTGIVGDTAIVSTDLAALRASLATGVTRAGLAPSKGFGDDVVDTPGVKTDNERIEYDEQAGKFDVYENLSDKHSMLPDTVIGMIGAIDLALA